MLDVNQNADPDLKQLNLVYDELSKDARTITRDLSETVAAYFILGAYMLAFSFGLDFYMALSGGFTDATLEFWSLWAVFVNIVPISAGAFVLHRYHKLSTRYQTLFTLEKVLQIKEWRKKKGLETQ